MPKCLYSALRMTVDLSTGNAMIQNFTDDSMESKSAASVSVCCFTDVKVSCIPQGSGPLFGQREGL